MSDAGATTEGLQQLIRNELNLALTTMRQEMLAGFENMIKGEFAKIREEMAIAFQAQVDPEIIKTRRLILDEELKIKKAEYAELNLQFRVKQVEAEETIKTQKEVHNKLQQQEDTERIRLLNEENVLRSESTKATRKRMLENEALVRKEKMVIALKEEVELLKEIEEINDAVFPKVERTVEQLRSEYLPFITENADKLCEQRMTNLAKIFEQVRKNADVQRQAHEQAMEDEKEIHAQTMAFDKEKFDQKIHFHKEIFGVLLGTNKTAKSISAELERQKTLVSESSTSETNTAEQPIVSKKRHFDTTVGGQTHEPE